MSFEISFMKFPFKSNSLSNSGVSTINLNLLAISFGISFFSKISILSSISLGNRFESNFLTFNRPWIASIHNAGFKVEIHSIVPNISSD